MTLCITIHVQYTYSNTQPVKLFIRHDNFALFCLHRFEGESGSGLVPLECSVYM